MARHGDVENRIFLSYRHEDSPGYAGRLFDQLSAHFGSEQIFIDIDTMRPGVDFVDEIDRAIAGSRAVLVLIGPNWLRL